jgi:hypothetical protein
MLCWFTYIDNVWIFFHTFYHVLYACFANLPNKGGNYGRNMTYISYWSYLLCRHIFDVVITNGPTVRKD